MHADVIVLIAVAIQITPESLDTGVNITTNLDHQAPEHGVSPSLGTGQKRKSTFLPVRTLVLTLW